MKHETDTSTQPSAVRSRRKAILATTAWTRKKEFFELRSKIILASAIGASSIAFGSSIFDILRQTDIKKSEGNSSHLTFGRARLCRFASRRTQSRLGKINASIFLLSLLLRFGKLELCRNCLHYLDSDSCSTPARPKVALLAKNDHNPIHVHVVKGGAEARFQVQPDVKLLDNRGLKPAELKLAEAIVEENREIITARWNEYFKKQD